MKLFEYAHIYPYIHIHYVHLASIIFEHSVCPGSLITTYIMLFAWFIEYCLVHLLLPKCPSKEFSGLYYPVFGLNIEIYRINLCINSKYKNTDKKNFSRSDWYQQSVTVHHVPKCMSCNKTIVVITEGRNCFHDRTHITAILLLWDLSTLSVVDHDYIYSYIHIYSLDIYIYTLYKCTFSSRVKWKERISRVWVDFIDFIIYFWNKLDYFTEFIRTHIYGLDLWIYFKAVLLLLFMLLNHLLT